MMSPRRTADPRPASTSSPGWTVGSIAVDDDDTETALTVCLPQKNAATRHAAAAAKSAQNTIRPVRRRLAAGPDAATVSVILPI